MDLLSKLFPARASIGYEQMRHITGDVSPHVTAVMFFRNYDKQRLLDACESLTQWGLMGNISDLMILAENHDDAEVCHAAIKSIRTIMGKYDVVFKIK